MRAVRTTYIRVRMSFLQQCTQRKQQLILTIGLRSVYVALLLLVRTVIHVDSHPKVWVSSSAKLLLS